EVRSIVVETPFTRKVDRRKFINGRWTTGAADQAPESVEIASILVQARPEHLDAVARTIEALSGAQNINDAASHQLKALTIEVINCSPVSKLTAYPKLTIEEGLKRWNVTIRTR